MAFKFSEVEIPGPIIIESSIWKDERGFFTEIFKKSDFEKFGITGFFTQENKSFSKKGVLRGLHMQINPKAQAKLIWCVRGEIFDVAVDLRLKSPTYGKWIGINLSAENKKQFFIPEGFLHGFCVLSDEAEIVYKCTAEYDPALEKGVIWNDTAIGINWPVENPIISERDAALPLLENYENYER
ncbi:MAG: dTDP-4-dehydrorhamnose 3,5-epimerase [Candidatus Paceibacterota bacterium]